MAEEFEQLYQQNDTPPVMLHLPSANMSHDSSSTHITSDNVLPGDTSAEWSPLGQSPLMSSSLTNSRQLTPSPYLESSDSRESPIPMSHDHTQQLYRLQGRKGSGSHEQQSSPESELHDPYQNGGSHDQHRRSHDHHHYHNGESHDPHDHQHYHYRGSHDQGSHDQGSYDAYISMDSFSCPNLSTLESYGEKRHLQHFSNDGNSAVWDDRYHDNCASMSNIHLQSGTSRDRPGNRHTPSRRSFNGVSNILPSLVEESTSPPTMPPPSHVYKVMIDMASLIVFMLLV